MSDTPKPLPRTKIPARPVAVAEFPKTVDLKCSSEQFLSQTRLISKSVTQIVDCEHKEQSLYKDPEVQSINETFDHSYDYHETIVVDQSKRSHDSSRKSSGSSSKSKNEDDSLKKSHEDKDQHSEMYSKDDVDYDDDDDMVNEILKYKKSSLEKKLLENENIKNSDDISEQLSGKTDDSSRSDNTDTDASSGINEEEILGIHIHRSDCLKMDHIIRHPSVILHIVDEDKKGEYMQKSQPNKNVTYNQEQSNFILPVMTRPFSFKQHGCIVPQWEETLTFNESTSHIIKPTTIFFFEIVDFVDSCDSDANYASIGWSHMAWGFLKPVGKNNTLNIDKMLRLQLYYGDPKATNISHSSVPYVYKWYQKKHWRRYPSTLYVTVKGISLCKINAKPQQRSCTPFQPEVGSDASIKSLALFSNGDDSMNSKNFENQSAVYRLVSSGKLFDNIFITCIFETILVNAVNYVQTATQDTKKALKYESKACRNNIEWSRIPGQSCRLPNTRIATLYPDPKGCLAVSFSHNGIFLACGTCNDIFIYAVDGVLERRLINHLGLIYTLCWFTDDTLLLSASADCTACIWDMKSSSETPLQILPHPSFVYCSTFVFPEQTVVTGCFDGTVRIWWQTHACSRQWQLHQELNGHEEYVSALCSFKNKEFFSGDSNGVIIHWTSDEFGRWFKLNLIKLLEIQCTIINKLIVFPGQKRLLIHTRDSLIRTMDIKTSVIIQWYQGGLNDSSQSNSVITPCGSLILATSEDATVNVWESNTGKHIAFYSSGNVTAGCGGAVDFHPFDHIAAFSFYSIGNSMSSVNLLKYSANITRSPDVMLYMLNENTHFPYDPSSLCSIGK